MTRLNWLGKCLATCLLMASLGTIAATTADAGGSDPGYQQRACQARRVSPLAIRTNGPFYTPLLTHALEPDA